MSNVDVLRHSIAHTHENLENRLQRARAMTARPGPAAAGPRGPRRVPRDGQQAPRRRGRRPVPAVHTQVDDGDRLVHDYVHAEKELELALAHVKARAYGSAYDADRFVDVGRGRTWRPRLASHRGSETRAGRGADRRHWTPGAGRPDRADAGRGGRRPDPAAPVRPAHRRRRAGLAQGHARGRRVLGHHRGPDAPREGAARATGSRAGSRSTSWPTPGSTRTSRRRPRSPGRGLARLASRSRLVGRMLTGARAGARVTRFVAMRVLLALGGNAMTNADGRARPEDQIAAAEVAMEAVADLVAQDVDVVITHGNGPQVGNLLVKNELAAAVVPPVPLDWCGAQTQATLGFVLMDALDAALARRGVDRPHAPPWSPAPWSTPTTRASPRRPSRSAASCPPRRRRYLVEHGETWEDRGEKGWRRRGRLARAARGRRRARPCRRWSRPGSW